MAPEKAPPGKGGRPSAGREGEPASPDVALAEMEQDPPEGNGEPTGSAAAPPEAEPGVAARPRDDAPPGPAVAESPSFEDRAEEAEAYDDAVEDEVDEVPRRPRRRSGLGRVGRRASRAVSTALPAVGLFLIAVGLTGMVLAAEFTLPARAAAAAAGVVLAGLAVRAAVVLERLRRAEANTRLMVQGSNDLIVLTDEEGVIRQQSPSGVEVLGCGPGELVGQRALDLVHPEDVPHAGRLFEEALSSPNERVTLEIRMRHADGSWRWVEARARALLPGAGVSGVLMSFRDVTERRALEEEVEHQAFHDPLTGLANRALFKDRVEHARTRRGHPLPAVLFVDIDGFKAVNDSLGHAAGDDVLVQVAERLSVCVRPEDTVARLGGDEFAILLDDVADPRDAGNVAARILESMQEPFRLGDKEVFVSASVGVAVHETESAGQLLRDADVALYMAKAQGKGRFVVFDPRTHTSTLDRLELEADLRRATERGEFVLYYQPVVELRTERIVGVEALVRWNHPERGLILPHDFIPLAEDANLIADVGRWVVVRAFEQAMKWQRAFPTDPPLALSVNLSATELQGATLVEDLARAASDAGADPSNLIVEITESLMLRDAEATIAKLRELKELGVRLAVDDFGVGYSSLSHLQRFPIDVLKIDPSFVEGLDRGPEDAALARAIVKLAQMLRLQVVAEGVEREGQLEELRELGAHMAQGFIFARPLDEATMTALLERAFRLGRLGMPNTQATRLP